MNRGLKALGWLAVGAAAVFGVLYVTGEGSRRAAAVSAAVAQAKAIAEQEKAEAAREAAEAIEAAVAAAVAETETRLMAEIPPQLPEVDSKLAADEETLALFPRGAFLMEVGGDYGSARCGDIKTNVHWVWLYPAGPLRSTMERQEVSATPIILGILTFGLSLFTGPYPQMQTIFAARTEGRYTTLILGALRNGSDPDVVAPQVRLTLYRIDHSNFGVVERAPINEPPAARPEDGPPRYGQILRRCTQQNGESVDL